LFFGIPVDMVPPTGVWSVSFQDALCFEFIVL
jgi:hypothetical protein